MIQFLIKRFIGLLFVITGVTFITFMLGYVAPGDPIRNLLGQHFSPTTYAVLRHAYGLDLPWYQQYGNYVLNLLHGNFGTSFVTANRPVWDILKDGVPVSAELGLGALIIQILVGVPIGIISALRANTLTDTASMTGMLILYSLPPFVLATFAQVIIVWLHSLTGGAWPVANWGTPWHYSWADIQFKLAPILVVAALLMGYTARLSRTTMLEVLRQDFVRTARSKGLHERRVIYLHTFRNAMIPLITVFGYSFGLIITGAFFTEQIFNIPGIAQASIVSIGQRDYPVIQATTVLLAVAVVFGNALSDILYSVADPRIKVQ